MTAAEYAKQQGIAKTTARRRLEQMVAEGKATVKTIDVVPSSKAWSSRPGEGANKAFDYTIKP
jgi:predicted ArsR family transcriptional regulator